MRRGLLGPLPLKRLHPLLAKVVERYPEKALIPPIDIDGTVHLIRVEEILRAELDDSLRQQLLVEQRNRWLASRCGGSSSGSLMGRPPLGRLRFMSMARRCLEACALLREAGEEAIAALARRAELVALEMGKPFQRAGQLAAGVALVQEGRLRRVWNPPGFEALSLGTIEQDEWAGWGSALRDEPDLTLIASQPTRLVFIPLAEAQAAVAKHDSLRQALATPLLEELAVLLLPDLQRRGLRVEDPRALLAELISQTRLLRPGSPLPEEHWLCFSGPSAAGLPSCGHHSRSGAKPCRFRPGI